MYSNLPNCSSIDDVLASVEAMRMQESTGYKVNDDFLYTSSVPAEARGPLAADADCRTKMAEWCYQVVDFCKFNRETVAIAMDYLDRYLMVSPETIADRKVFQLAAMTCLYTAVKVHEPEAMEPSTIASLSRGAYTEEQVEAMERSILMKLQWRMNPPTALAFVHHYISLTQAPAEILEASKFQTELAVSEYDLVGVPKSAIAVCALANAGMGNEDLAAIAKATNFDISERVIQTQDLLYKLMQNAGMAPQAPQPRAKPIRSRSGGGSEESPRTIQADY